MCNFSSLWHVLFLKRPALNYVTRDLFLSAGLTGEMLQLRNGIVPVGSADRRSDRNRDREREHARGYRLVPSPNRSRPSNRLQRWNEFRLAYVGPTGWKSWPDFFSGPSTFDRITSRCTLVCVQIRSRYRNGARHHRYHEIFHGTPPPLPLFVKL